HHLCCSYPMLRWGSCRRCWREHNWCSGSIVGRFTLQWRNERRRCEFTVRPTLAFTDRGDQQSSTSLSHLSSAARAARSFPAGASISALKNWLLIPVCDWLQSKRYWRQFVHSCLTWHVILVQARGRNSVNSICRKIYVTN